MSLLRKAPTRASLLAQLKTASVPPLPILKRLNATAIASLDLETLFGLVEAHGGHFTVFRFSSHWKCAFGTPDLHGFDDAGYEQVLQLPHYSTLKEALASMLVARTTLP